MELPEVNIVELVTELFGEYPNVRYDGEVEFSYVAGSVKLVTKRAPTFGQSEYRGVHHPNVVCEGGGICKWCGRTLEF